MNLNGITKMYDRLTPSERFRVTVMAMARADHDEVKRLVNACPRKRYEQVDDRYQRRLDAAHLIVYVAAIDLMRAMWDLDTLFSAGVYLYAQRDDKAPPVELWEARRKGEASAVQSLLVAFKAFCRETLEIEPEQVWASWLPFMPEMIERSQQKWYDAQDDAEAVAYFRDHLDRLWREYFGIRD